MRKFGTTLTEGSFSRAVIDAVWAKAQPIPNEDDKKNRRDALGNWIIRDHYGNTGATTGWEIDHIKPVARGGTDDLSNLQPLQWQANRAKGDRWP